MFDLSEESIEALKGMVGKTVKSIHCLHLDWRIHENQVTIYEDLVWAIDGTYILMKAQEIDNANDYYSFSIQKQDLPDPLPYEINELGQLGFQSISSIHTWSRIEQITLLSLRGLNQEEPPYTATLFQLENEQVVGVAPNFPWGFNLYFGSAAWKLVEGKLKERIL